MFKKLKNKLKSWTQKVSEEVEEKEEIMEEPLQKKSPDIPKSKKEEKTLDSSEKTKKEEEHEKKGFLKKIFTKKPETEELEKPKEEPKSKAKPKEPEIEKTETITELLEERKEEKAKDELKELEIPTKEAVEKSKEKENKEKLEKIEKKYELEKPKEKGFFKKITSKIKKVKLSEEDFDVYEEELELLLLENNVALEVAEKIIKELREEIVGEEFLKKEIESEIQDIFKQIVRRILVEPFDIIKKIKEREEKTKPYVILFCGVNGTGKTTTIAKIAQQLKENNLKPVLAAADTFRAASIEQIKMHGKKLGVDVIAHEYESDPASVGFDAIKHAEKKHADCVLIDTAGRMHTAKNLMSQIEKISKVTKPNLKIFVGESITGNDIIEQVKSFDWSINIDGIILSKADIDDKGGTALSVGYVTKKPILYLGTGQEYNKIESFNKEKFIEKLGLNNE